MIPDNAGDAGVTSHWRRWLQQPQRLGWRRWVFHVHMWSGVITGLYILFASITGSVLVYRNEMYLAALVEPQPSTGNGPLLTDDELRAAALDQFAGYEVTALRRPSRDGDSVAMTLRRGGQVRMRQFDARSGADVGSADDRGLRMVTMLMDLHANLLAGPTGRKINGLGATAMMVLAMTGAIIWWPGIRRWRRSLWPHRGHGWRRTVWDIHSAVGCWSYAFIVIFGLSGLYLCYPVQFHELADVIQPPTATNLGRRLIDSVLYWLAFLHFGRINGIGLPCDGPGLCDQATKAVWAVFGLAPATMFITGVTMWWNRKLRPRKRPGVHTESPDLNPPAEVR